MKTTKLLAVALLCAASFITASSAWSADKKVIAVDEVSAFLEFADYSGGVIFAEQIPQDQYAKTMIIDTRDAKQFAQKNIPGSINIDWRQVLEQSSKIPKNKLVVVYCNTGALSAQAGFALRLASWDNVRILHGGMDEWAAKGGLDAYARAVKKTTPPH